MYSGLLECPCTDAFVKSIADATTLQSGTCPAYSMVSTADRCFGSAARLGLRAKLNITVDTEAAPAGCYATAISGGFEIAFNSNTRSTQECGVGSSGGGSGAGNLKPNRRVAKMEVSACDACSVDVDIQPTAMARSVDISGDWIIGGNLNAGTLVKVTRNTTAAGQPHLYSAMCNGPACGPTGWRYLGSRPVVALLARPVKLDRVQDSAGSGSPPDSSAHSPA